jgi:hypothetical protein
MHEIVTNKERQGKTNNTPKLKITDGKDQGHFNCSKRLLHHKEKKSLVSSPSAPTFSTVLIYI